MSRIPTPAMNEMPVETQRLLSPVRDRFGMVPNSFRVIAHSPAALEGFLGFCAALGQGALDLATRERIAVAISEANGSDYCLSGHIQLARNEAKLDDAEITANRSGVSNDIKADIAVRFATKLVRDYGEASAADIIAIKEAGYSDAAIIDMIAQVSLSVFTNYINKAIGTEVDFPHVKASRPNSGRRRSYIS